MCWWIQISESAGTLAGKFNSCVFTEKNERDQPQFSAACFLCKPNSPQIFQVFIYLWHVRQRPRVHGRVLVEKTNQSLILALVLSLSDSSMGSRVSLPWTAPCWQSSWPKRGNQSLPVMVIIKLEIRWYSTYMVLWLWVENTQGIKFGHHFSDHMLTVAWEQGRGWVWFS